MPNKKTCLVTGHKGYIGSHLAKELKNRGHEVVGVDLLGGQDVRDMRPRNYQDVDIVFHLAALPRVQQSVEEPAYTLNNNVYGTSKVLRLTNKINAERFVFASSSAVYGDGNGPKSPYGAQKKMSEIECQLYADLYGVDTVCLRYFNVYSEDQPYDGPYSTVIANWMHLLEEGKPLRIDGDGTQKRDFIHVEDVVDITIECGFFDGHDIGLRGTCLDIGTFESHSVNEIKEIVEEVQNDVEFCYSDPREGDVEETKAKRHGLLWDLDWSPSVGFEEGMKRCFEDIGDE